MGALALCLSFSLSLQAATLHWDVNADVAGSGNAGGTWDSGITSNWSSAATGDVATTTFTDGDIAVFSAGTDGTGSWTVNVSGLVQAGGITFEEDGSKTINGGTIDATAIGATTPAAATMTTLATTGVTTLGNRLALVAQSVNMADATRTLILSGTPSGAQTLLSGNVLIVDPASGGAGEDLILPLTASCTGLVLFIFSGGNQDVVVKNSSGSTVATIVPGKAVVVACNGSDWGALLGA